MPAPVTLDILTFLFIFLEPCGINILESICFYSNISFYTFGTESSLKNKCWCSPTLSLIKICICEFSLDKSHNFDLRRLFYIGWITLCVQLMATQNMCNKGSTTHNYQVRKQFPEMFFRKWRSMLEKHWVFF